MEIKLNGQSFSSTNDYLSSLFDNQPKLLRTDSLAVLIDMSRETIYDMKSRPLKYKIPPEVAKVMFVKIGNELRIRTDVFKSWWISRVA